MTIRTIGVWLLGLAALASAVPVSAAEAEPTVRVLNCDLLALEKVEEDAAAPGAPGPVSIVGARNGHCSGKVLVSGDPTVDELEATVSDLASDRSTIPASAVSVRYGAAWQGMPGWYCPAGLDILLEEPPSGAPLVSVWVTVHVPADAAPGLYEGTLRIRASGLPAVEMPIRLDVKDWTLPDTDDHRAWVELIQSPDTLSVEYGVPLWSEEHWKLIGEAMDLIGGTSSRVAYIPLIAHTNMGNEESMVRWVRKGDESLECDFSIMDRYLDMFEERIGKPKVVCFCAWDVYLRPPKEEPAELPEERRGHSYFEWVKAMEEARWALRDKGPYVTFLDPVTGETANEYLPRYEDSLSADLWKPVYAELRERMRARGLEDAMALGMLTDTYATKEQVAFLDGVSGGLPWVLHTHGGSHVQPRVYDIADVIYTTYVWNIEVTLNPELGRTYGWRRPELIAAHYRLTGVNRMLPSRVRGLIETNITGNQRGVGRIGGDYWWSVKDKRGRRSGTVNDRYLEGQWRNLDIKASVLGPGPDGPVATARYEYLREGAQECEARIFLESVLLDDARRARIGEDLATRCQDLLDLRQRALWKARGLSDEVIAEHGPTSGYWRILEPDEDAGQAWFVQSNWQKRTAELFALAGEVARKLARP